jgi:hypothetical protein
MKLTSSFTCLEICEGGLGIGVGKVFKVISEDIKKEAWTMTSLNGGFARGLGHGLGSIRPFLSVDLVTIILITRKY